MANKIWVFTFHHTLSLAKTNSRLKGAWGKNSFHTIFLGPTAARRRARASCLGVQKEEWGRQLLGWLGGACNSAHLLCMLLAVSLRFFVVHFNATLHANQPFYYIP